MVRLVDAFAQRRLQGRDASLGLQQRVLDLAVLGRCDGARQLVARRLQLALLLAAGQRQRRARRRQLRTQHKQTHRTCIKHC